MSVHLRTFYTYMTNQQSHIYKCAQSHIIILHQHVSVTHVTITLQQHVSATHVTITVQQHVSVTHVTIILHQHVSVTLMTAKCFGHSYDRNMLVKNNNMCLNIFKKCSFISLSYKYRITSALY